MIVGCYTLDLYCDTPGCRCNDRGGKYLPDQFTGQTEGECLKDARRFGWRMDMREKKAYCPECAQKGKP